MPKKRGKLEIPAIWCVHDDHWYLKHSIESFAKHCNCVVFVSKKAWNGSDGNWEQCAKVAEEAGAEIVIGDWPDESLHRRTALAEAKQRMYSWAFIPDGDEIISKELLANVLKIGTNDLADLVRVRMDTYWKSAEYVIRPREELAPIIALNCQKVEHDYIREYNCGRTIVLGPEYGLLHHLSYAGPEERIHRKIETWGHRHEVIQNWKEEVWRAWDENRSLQNLHPTHPPFYGYAERIEIPELLRNVQCPRMGHNCPEKPELWPKVSIIIPLYGGKEDIENCLESLSASKDLLLEVIVVNDASPDDAAQGLDKFPFVNLLSNKSNLGFGLSCNFGYEASSGDVVIFLNSDTRVPRAGLIRLVESLTASGTIGAVGPMTNNSGYYQRINPTYSTTSNLNIFANDFANSEAEDEDVSMLVGFCLAVKKSVLNEVGGRPFDPTFGKALFEDTDLCYRILRAGYRLLLASKSYVHHEGSKTLNRQAWHPKAALSKNEALYRAKWKEDLEFGFASHLSGIQPGLITFKERRRPDKVKKAMLNLAKKVKISLCMIVKDEERVIRDCLSSVKGVFSEIVIVDTGSTDSTVEIAKEYTQKVYEIEWPNSFSNARNESLKHSSGDWIFWMDADDTLPLASAEAILRAADSAPKDVVGFIIPVQFVDEGGAGGTRVDHVKLFRRYPDIEFEGRIHEQILASLRRKGGKISRLNAVVLHSGYDTSVEGQAKKRIRDEKLLKLDFEERPEHPFVHFNLGMTAHYCDDHESAVKWLTSSIELATEEESHVRKAYALMGASVKLLGDKERSLKIFTEGLDKVGQDPDILFQRALLLGELSRPEEALADYLSMPDSADDHFSSLDRGILGFKRSYNIAQLFFQTGRYLNARDWWRRSLTENPDFLPGAEMYFEAALTIGSPPDMMEALNHVLRITGGSEQWAIMRLKMSRILGQNEDEDLHRLFRDYPGLPGPGLILAKKHLEQGQVALAIPILLHLDICGCAEASFLLSVAKSQSGHFKEAMHYMQRAHELAPNHEQTREQLSALERLIEENPEAE